MMEGVVYIMDFIEVGKRIRNQRKRLSISQQELAETVGYKGKEAISRIESGQINIPMNKLMEITKALQMNVSDLFDTYQHVSPSSRNIIKTLEELPEADKQRIMSYIEVIRRANLWQQQSGTEHAGGSESHRAE